MSSKNCLKTEKCRLDFEKIANAQKTSALQIQGDGGCSQRALQSAIESLLLQTMVQILEQMTLIRYLSNGHRDRVLENLIYLRDAADAAIAAETTSASCSYSRERY